MGAMKLHRHGGLAAWLSGALVATMLPLLGGLTTASVPLPCMAMEMTPAAGRAHHPAPAAPRPMADCQNGCPAPCAPALPAAPGVPERVAPPVSTEFHVADGLRAGLPTRPDLPPPRRR